MKTGDLVKWTHPNAEDFGIVLDEPPTKFGEHEAHIYWFGSPECSGYYSSHHELLEHLGQ
jgi:hypothetical protein